MLRHTNNEIILYWGSNKAHKHWNHSIICVSMKIVNMLFCLYRFGGPKMSLLGPMLGSIFLLFGASRADKSRASRTATPFLLIFEGVQNGSIFEGSRGRLKNDPCAPWGGKGTTKTPRRTARSSPSSPSWDLGSLGTPRARQGLIKINQGLIKQGLLLLWRI